MKLFSSWAEIMETNLIYFCIAGPNMNFKRKRLSGVSQETDTRGRLFSTEGHGHKCQIADYSYVDYNVSVDLLRSHGFHTGVRG